MVSGKASNVEVNNRERERVFALIKILIIKKVFLSVIFKVSLLHEIIFDIMMAETGYLVKFR